MCEAPVFYATTDGQTRRIAEALAATLRERGVTSQAFEVGGRDAAAFPWARARAAVVAASVRVGKHQRQAEAFVRRHLTALNARPTVFVSVSLSICSALPHEVEAAWARARAFPAGLGWRPERVACVAGRLAYTQYGLLTRFIMKRIAAKSGGPTDTSRDYEMTNWAEVRELAADLASRLAADTPMAPVAAAVARPEALVDAG